MNRRRSFESRSVERMAVVFPRYLRPAAVAAVLSIPVASFAQAGGQPQRGQRPAARQPAGGAAPAASDVKEQLKTFEDKLSYVLGVNAARRMRNDNVEPNPQVFARGFIDEFGDKNVFNEDEMAQILAEFDKQLKAKVAEAKKQLAEDWQASFAEDKKPAGEPKATKSGLKYEVFEQGDGPKPKPTDVAVFHYEGRLAKDGKVFDSSIERGEPLVYPVNQLIPGWVEGLPMMSVGSKYRFYIPAALGYGEQGFPPRIGPNENLIFDIHLVDIAPQDEGQAGAPEAPPADTPAPPE